LSGVSEHFGKRGGRKERWMGEGRELRWIIGAFRRYDLGEGIELVTEDM